MLRNFICVRIDTERDSSTGGKYGVRGIPDTRILKADGTQVARIGGYLDPDEFVVELQQGLAAAK